MGKNIFKSVILGAPGAGKGTISAQIVKHFKVVHISSGDKLRQNIKEKTPIGLEAESYIRAGKLVPDKTMIKFILGEVKKISDQSWLLDGFPRTLSQAKALWDVQELDLAINLDVPKEVIVERLKGRMIHPPSGRVYNKKFNAPKVAGKDDVTGEPLIQRADDKPVVILKRYLEYVKVARTITKFYEEKKILKTFRGEKSNEIWLEIKSIIEKHLRT